MRIAVLLAVVLTAAGCSYFARPAEKVKVHSLFTDNMVLQRDVKVPVWGKAAPGGKVTVLFNGQKHAVTAAADSQWRLHLDPMEAGGPFTLKVFGRDTLRFEDVMVGEVWVCSGQSNMEMPLAGWGQVDNYVREIAAADLPNIRLFQVNHKLSLRPLWDIDAQGWVKCSPKTVPLFSATAYFFGRMLHQELGVPVGLIHSSWGGTVAEAWTSAGALAQLEDFKPLVEEIQQELLNEGDVKATYEKRLAEWQKLVEEKIAAARQETPAWQSPDYNDSSWPKMKLPVLWESAGLPNFDGIVWFRKTVVLPENAAELPFSLSLGPIDDQEVTFVNGVQAGSTDGYNKPRQYTLPAGMLRPGKNVIAVQVLDTGGGGGLWGSPEQMTLTSGSLTFDLSGEWAYQPAVSLRDVPPRPQPPDNPNRPTVLYNAMLSPLMPFAVRGAIWYQGESNAGRAEQYRILFPTLINCWRTAWGLGDFPFLFVQLANFRPATEEPVESDWAELREAQLMTLSLPNTGMAVAIDIGDANDIHPKNKQEVGRRLALNALAKVYGRDIVYSGPIYKAMSFEGDKIRLSFDHTGSGLEARGGRLTGFTIAGDDKKFVKAQAVIDGNTVLVWSPQLPSPVAVRYAWADNPVCNLYNKEGLPASPFRTDDWPGITHGVK